MLQLQGFRNRTFTIVIAQWLVALFLFQAAFPIQAHSRLDSNKQGTPVVICTLQGERTVMLDFADNLHAHALLSAAMNFSDLVNDLSPILPIAKPPVRVLGTVQVQQQLMVHVATQAIVDPSSRAPPRA